MIKNVILPMVVASSLFGAHYPSNSDKKMTTPHQGQSKMHQMQQKHPDRLPDDQRHVMFMLSPMYQRIYLYAFDDDQREMVAVFERRGENPYQAMDNIMARDRHMADPSFRKKCRPSDNPRHSCRQTKYIISEENKSLYDEEGVVADNSEDYEFYENEDTNSHETACGYREKPDYKGYKKSGHCSCNVSCGCEKEESGKKPKSSMCTLCGKKKDSKYEDDYKSKERKKYFNRSEKKKSMKEKETKSMSKSKSDCCSTCGKSYESEKKEKKSFFWNKKSKTEKDDSTGEYRGKKKYQYKDKYSKKKRSCGCSG